MQNSANYLRYCNAKLKTVQIITTTWFASVSWRRFWKEDLISQQKWKINERNFNNPYKIHLECFLFPWWALERFCTWRGRGFGDFQINSNDVALPQFIRLFSCFLCSSFELLGAPAPLSFCRAHPVNLIQSLSFKSRRPREKCNVDWRGAARALFSPNQIWTLLMSNVHPCCSCSPRKVLILIFLPGIITPKPLRMSVFSYLLSRSLWQLLEKWPRALRPDVTWHLGNKYGHG